MTQIDHLIEAVAKEIGGDRRMASRTLRKKDPLDSIWEF
jgi:hypothetical protein